MRTLPTHPLSPLKLIMTVITSYSTVFPQIMLFVALSSIGHLIIPPLFMLNPAFAGVATIGFILLTWFLYTAILVKSKVALLGGRMTTAAALRSARQHYLAILGSNLIFFAIGIFMWLIVYALQLIFDLVDLHPVYLILSAAINIAIFVYLYFAIPEIALERITIVGAFEKSVRLVKNHWWRTFIVLAFFGAVILGFEALGILFTGKSRLLLFTAYHFAIQFIFYPVIITTTLVLLNDLKLRATHDQNFS